MGKQIRKHTCKYCKTRTHNIGACQNCREKMAVFKRIKELLK